MAKKLYEENDIQAIANAIRGKNGSTDTYKVSEMATAIEGIPSGGNLEDFIPEEAFHITGNCSYRFGFGKLDWFLERYGDRMTSSEITHTDKMFRSSTITNVPFDLNFADGGGSVNSMFYGCGNLKTIPSMDFKQAQQRDCGQMFYQCYYLEEIGKLSNLYPSQMLDMFHHCNRLRYLPEFENLNLSYIQTNACNNRYMFSYCYSLRKIPESFLNQIYGVQTDHKYTQFYYAFRSCIVLDEIVGMNPQTGMLTADTFVETFFSVARAKDIIFKMQEDGLPYTVRWKNQVIDLTQNVGWYGGKASNISFYNSGITIETLVSDDETYQALKNHPDWYTVDVNYSRYNHDSAVNTINSLPDTSAYITSYGGTNTIKFKGESGKLTDGGAINTLTEAEIAVATAKGWTVTFV